MGKEIKTFAAINYCIPLLCVSLFSASDAFAKPTICSGSSPTVSCTGTDASVAISQCKTTGATLMTKANGQPIIYSDPNGAYHFNCTGQQQTSAGDSGQSQVAAGAAPKANDPNAITGDTSAGVASGDILSPDQAAWRAAHPDAGGTTGPGSSTANGAGGTQAQIAAHDAGHTTGLADQSGVQQTPLVLAPTGSTGPGGASTTPTDQASKDWAKINAPGGSEGLASATNYSNPKLNSDNDRTNAAANFIQSSQDGQNPGAVVDPSDTTKVLCSDVGSCQAAVDKYSAQAQADGRTDPSLEAQKGGNTNATVSYTDANGNAQACSSSDDSCLSAHGLSRSGSDSGKTPGGQSSSDTKMAASEDKSDANQYKANKFTASLDDCNLSAQAGGTSCSGMRTAITATKIGAQVASTIGSQAVSMIGQQSQQNAILNGGSIASIYQSSAALQAKAAAANIGMGAVQVGMGVIINSQANSHQKEYKNNFQNIGYSDNFNQVAQGKGKAGVTGPDDITITGSGGQGDSARKVFNNAVSGDVNGTSTNPNAKTSRVSDLTKKDGIDLMTGNQAHITNADGTEGNSTMKAKAQAAMSSAQSYADAASAEQKGASVDGHAAALTNFMQGGGAMVSGTFQYLQAKQMEKLYAAMANAPTVTAPGADPFAAPGAIRAAGTVTGDGTSGTTSAATAATAPAPTSSNGPLGAPLGNIPGGPAFGTPTDPGAAAAATPGNQGGGGAGAGGGIGTSAVPGGSTDEKQAQYDAGRNTAPYEGVGGFSPGGGGGKGNSNDPSIDPKTLMAAMLDQMGQKKDEDTGIDIRNYRNIASDANAPLPAEENFFKRFHDDYQEFQRKGQVGL